MQISDQPSVTYKQISIEPKPDKICIDKIDLMPSHLETQGRHSWLKGLVHKKANASSSLRSEEVGECLACATEFPLKRLVVLTCPGKHRYCHGCFEKLLQVGCQNEAVFPPQCCQVSVPHELIRSKGTRNVRKAYDKLNEVVKIAPENRWYCPNSKCGKTIDVETAKVSRRGLRCPQCRREICVSCKQPAHSNAFQCNDEALIETRRTSKEQGWRRCYRCGEMIELQEGCRHITCHCRAQFCYICGRRWDTCVNSTACAHQLYQSREEENARNATEQNVDDGGNADESENPFVEEDWEDPWQEEEIEEALQQSEREYNETLRRRRTLDDMEEQDVARAIEVSSQEFDDAQKAAKLAEQADLAELQWLAELTGETREDADGSLQRPTNQHTRQKRHEGLECRRS